MEKLWTTSEVARYLGINEVDVEQLVRAGQLTGYRLGGQFLRFRPSQVETLKGTVRFRQNRASADLIERRPRVDRLLDFFYFYDFYLVSAGLLAGMLVYLAVAW